jgi:hypothetical protein
MQNLDAEVNPSIAELEESNALALAIVAPGIVCTILQVLILTQLNTKPSNNL